MIMESLHGPVNNYLFEDGYFGGESNLEQESRSNTSGGYCTTSYGAYDLGYEQEDMENSKMSFLQMLQAADNTLHPTHNLLFPETPPNLKWATDPQICIANQQDGMKLPDSEYSGRKRKKRCRTRAAKDKEEMESQRITHITVERNRRRQMNDHLSALRSLMPPSYVQRGDQASIVGGAINFVKELEQLLESLQDRRRTREAIGEVKKEEGEDEKDTGSVKVKVTVLQKHVNLKVTVAKSGDARKRRRTSEVVRAILGFQHLKLTVLHLNITSLQSSAHYSFSLKIEDDCHLESADEVAGAVHQIFSFVNAS